MYGAAGNVEDVLAVARSRAISSAGPPWFRSVAQTRSSPSVSLRTSAMKSSRAGSSLGIFCESSRLPSASITTQWWWAFPASRPAHRCTKNSLQSVRWLRVQQITAPSRPYPAISVASLNQRSGHRGVAGGQSFEAVTRKSSGTAAKPYPPPLGSHDPTMAAELNPVTT